MTKGLKRCARARDELNMGVSDFKFCNKAKGTPAKSYFLHRALTYQETVYKSPLVRT